MTKNMKSITGTYSILVSPHKGNNKTYESKEINPIVCRTMCILTL